MRPAASSRPSPTAHNPNETQTEQDLIRPLLQLLGWTDDLPQQTTSGGEDRPDLLLFPDSEAKTRAGAQASPYLQALAVAELKRFRRPLDTRGPGKGTQASSPHAQIIRYLRGADSVTDGDLRWGILTNGAVWRLYDQKTRPRATAYYEADLQALLTADDQDGLRTFHLLFRRSAFLRTPGAPPPSWKPPWTKAAATNSASPRASPGSSSNASSPASSRPWPTPPTSPCPGSAKPPSSFSTACSSSSTPKTAASCPSTTPATMTTASASASATT